MESFSKAIIASVITLTCVCFNCPAQAVLLHGYLERESGQEVAPVNTDDQARAEILAEAASNLDQSLKLHQAISLNSGVERSCLQTQGAQTQALPAQADVPPPANSFPYAYVGTWRCVSEVIDSQVDSIEQGKKIVSDIVFAVGRDGRVVAQWNQPGWSQTNAQVTTFNAQEAKLVRTNYYADAGADGWWAARSSDQFKQISADQMVAQSYVDQYVAGDYKGRYHTKSMLFRVSKEAPRGIALSANPLAK
jgi:hypothetical protein